MRIGVLETGAPPAALVAEHGRYDAMVQRLLGDGHSCRTWRVAEGELPPAVEADDGYVITGSPAGVHDGLAWIDALAGFVRAARGVRPLVGICFGHQLIAHAFGGTVAKAPQGWGLGLHRYALVGTAPWLDGPSQVSGIASHQDQVIVPPPDAAVVARSDFTPVAVLAYPDGSALSVQFHPEFDADFARALTEGMQAPDLSPADQERAVASLDQPSDSTRVAGWINRFLESR